jgi:hypothetical protein
MIIIKLKDACPCIFYVLLVCFITLFTVSKLLNLVYIVKPLKTSDNYNVVYFCIYGSCMMLTVDSDYFLKQR